MSGPAVHRHHHHRVSSASERRCHWPRVGPQKITLSIRIKSYLQRDFIYSYLQKRSFILGSNTATA